MLNRIRVTSSIIANQQRISQNNNISSSNIKSSKINNGHYTDFKEVLDNIGSSELKFSKHAKSRLESRNINLTNEELDKLSSALDKADKKGVKEALLLMDNTALIASVRNRTIITVASENQLKENVFTNIDGAVIV